MPAASSEFLPPSPGKTYTKRTVPTATRHKTPGEWQALRTKKFQFSNDKIRQEYLSDYPRLGFLPGSALDGFSTHGELNDEATSRSIITIYDVSHGSADTVVSLAQSTQSTKTTKAGRAQPSKGRKWKRQPSISILEALIPREIKRPSRYSTAMVRK